ncbi:MAG: DUF5908 family protein [Chitinophagaceae bacterium]
MSIEIRELVIKATVTEPSDATSLKQTDAAFIQKLKKEILRECFEKIRREARIKNNR